MYLHGDIPVYEKNPFRESTFTYILNRSTYRSACFRMSEEQSGRCAGRDLSLYADTVIKPWGTRKMVHFTNRYFIICVSRGISATLGFL